MSKSSLEHRDKMRTPLVIGPTPEGVLEQAERTVRYWTDKWGGEWPQSCDTILMSLGLKENPE